MADAYSYLVAIFLIATVIVNFIINVVVLIMMRKRRLYVIVANRLFLQFVLIDFIACFFVFIPASVTAILESWAFSDPACHIHGVVSTLVYIVIFGLLIVRCVERITKIKNRELHKAVFCSNCRLMLVSLVVWLVGVVVSVIPLSGWISFKYDYYHSGCIVQLEESAVYLFLIFPLGVGITAVFVIIAFVIILKADKNVGDIERLNGGRGGWYMGNGSKPDENKNPNMATASANLIITTVSVIFFFPYFMIMFIRSAGVDMWRGAYSISLIPIVLTFTLRPFIYLFRLRMSIKAKEKSNPRIPGDKKRILAVSRKGKRRTLPNEEKRGDPGEPNYSSDEWSEYDEEKGKTCCFFPKSKRYDEKHAPPPPYESVPEKSHPKPSLKQKEDNFKKDKLSGDPVFKKPSLHDTKPNNDDVNDDEMSEFYLDGNSSENEFGKTPRNRLFHKKNNDNPSSKSQPKDQDDLNGTKNDKKRKLQEGKDSNSNLENAGNDPESFLSPRMIKIQENPKRKSKKQNDKTDEETLSSENSENERKSKRKRRHRRKPKRRLSDDESDSYYSYSEDDRPSNRKEKTKIIVIKQRAKSSDTKRNSPKSRKSNKIEPKENKKPIVEETLRKQNKLNPFLRPGVDKTDNNDKIKGEKTHKSGLNNSENSNESENSSDNDIRKKVSNKKLSDKNNQRKGPKKDQEDQAGEENNNRTKQKKKEKIQSNSDTDDHTDDERKRKKKRKRKKTISDDEDSQTNEENEKTVINKSKRKPVTKGDYKDEILSDDSIDPTINEMPKNVDTKTFGNTNDDISYGLENDTNPGINGNMMEEMLRKNIDSQIVPIVQNNCYYMDPTRMGNQFNPTQRSMSPSMNGRSQNEKGNATPTKAEWNKSDANNHPVSTTHPTETQNSLPRTYNNAPVNVDNLPESKSLNPTNENGNMKDVYENLGNGDSLEPYKRRKLVPNSSKSNGTTFGSDSSDKKFNPSGTMGQGDPIIPYNPYDQIESKEDDSSDIQKSPDNTNYKEPENILNVMGPGETIEPYSDGKYNPRSQRTLPKNMKKLNENNISSENQINDEDSPTMQSNNNKNKDLTNILGPGDPIIPHEDSEEDVTDSETDMDFPANGLKNQRNQDPDYIVNKPPHNYIDPHENHPSGKNSTYPNFSYPYDEDYIPPTIPYPNNSNFDPIYLQNITGGPKQHQDYPYLANGTNSGQNPEEFSNHKDTQNQYNPHLNRPHLNSGDYPFQGQNLSNHRDNPNNRSYPYLPIENKRGGMDIVNNVPNYTRDIPNNRNYPNVTTEEKGVRLDNVNNVPNNTSEPFQKKSLKDQNNFDPYTLNENEKRPYQRHEAPDMQNSSDYSPGDDRPNLHSPGYSTMPVDKKENRYFPNSNKNNKSDALKSNNSLANQHGNLEERKDNSNPKTQSAEKLNADLKSESPTTQREKAANPNNNNNNNNNNKGKATKPYFPRSNMHSTDKFNRFSNDPYKPPNNKDNPAHFQYIKPENADEYPNKSVSLPDHSTRNLNEENQPEEEEKHGSPNGNNNLHSAKNVANIKPTLQSRNDQSGQSENPDVLNNSQLPYNIDKIKSDLSFPNRQPNENNNKKQTSEIGPPKSYSSINQKPKDGRTVKLETQPLNSNVTLNPQKDGTQKPTSKGVSNSLHSNQEPERRTNKNNKEANGNSKGVKPHLPEDNQIKSNQNNQPQLRVNINDPIGLPQSYSSIRQKPKGGHAVKIGKRPPNFNSTDTGINSIQHPNNSNQVNPDIHDKPKTDNYSNPLIYQPTKNTVSVPQNEPSGLGQNLSNDDDQSKDNANTPGPNKHAPGKTKLGNISNPNHYNSDVEHRAPEKNPKSQNIGPYNQSMMPEDINDGRNNPMHKNYPPITNTNNGNNNNQKQHYTNASQDENKNLHRLPNTHADSRNHQEVFPNTNGQYPGDNRNNQHNYNAALHDPGNGSNGPGFQDRQPAYNKPLANQSKNISQNNFDPYNVDLQNGLNLQGNKNGDMYNQLSKDNGMPIRKFNGSSTQNENDPSNVNTHDENGHLYNKSSKDVGPTTRNFNSSSTQNESDPSNRHNRHLYNESSKDNGQTTRNFNGSNTQNGTGQSNAYQHNKMPHSQGNQKPDKKVTFEQNETSLKENNSPKNEIGSKRPTTLKGKEMWDTADKKMSAYYHLTRIDKWDMVHGYDNKYDKRGKPALTNSEQMKKQVKDVDLL